MVKLSSFLAAVVTVLSTSVDVAHGQNSSTGTNATNMANMTMNNTMNVNNNEVNNTNNNNNNNNNKNSKNVAQVVSSDWQLSTLVSALSEADLVSILRSDGPFTVFAPKNYPFSQLPPKLVSKLLSPKWSAHLQDLLLYHVFIGAPIFSNSLKPTQTIEMANGEEVTVEKNNGRVVVNGNAKVREADMGASNGVVHKISQVLQPNSIKYSIPEIISRDPQMRFDTLIKLVMAAGLDDDLSMMGPYTVFAPTDGAFRARLGDDAVDELLKRENRAMLRAVLKYHVVPGIYLSTDLKDEDRLKTLYKESKVRVNINKEMVIRIKNSVRDVGAKVVDADILANNGVVHVVADVLLPKM